MKPLFLCVLLQDCPLCFNAYAVTIVFIVPAQSHIKRSVVNRSIVRLFHRKNPPSKETTHAYNTTIYNTALYMRLSRDDELQGESGSIQTQRMMLRQYAAEHGLNVIDEYIER